MDLADASLVAVAERDGVNQVFTLDQRDFGVYRTARLGRFTIIP
jgi:predicted nucleic acid-binding protein